MFGGTQDGASKHRGFNLVKCAIMKTISKKKDILINNETAFANSLSMAVFEKPKMSVWMILIPLILVFHMYRHQRYVDGRNSFVENYLRTRKRAVEAAYSSCQSGEDIDIAQFVASSGVPEDTRSAFRDWVTLLVQHYQMLISSSGNNFDSLVRASYKTKMNYLLFLNALNAAEKRFSQALKTHIGDNTQTVENTIGKIDHHTEIIRRQSAEDIFS